MEFRIEGNNPTKISYMGDTKASSMGNHSEMVCSRDFLVMLGTFEALAISSSMVTQSQKDMPRANTTASAKGFFTSCCRISARAMINLASIK